MKKIFIDKNIITFVEDGQASKPEDDVTLVTRLAESPETADEIKALARVVLSLQAEREESTHGSTYRRTD